MQMHFTTIVATPIDEVVARFNKDFFEKLTPPGVPFKIVRFDGTSNQDRFHLKLGAGAIFPLPNLKIGPQSLFDWEGVISEIISDDDDRGFVDEGVVLPFPMKEWRHVHRFRKHSEYTTEIIDDVSFSTWAPPFNAVVSPAVLALFAFRKMIYIQEFGRI